MLYDRKAVKVIMFFEKIIFDLGINQTLLYINAV
jgi:hypothetical protein